MNQEAFRIWDSAQNECWNVIYNNKKCYNEEYDIFEHKSGYGEINHPGYKKSIGIIEEKISEEDECTSFK